MAGKKTPRLPDGRRLLREIHLFRSGGKDPRTGAELGDHCIVKREWDEELEKLRGANPAESVCCVEYGVSDEGDRECINHLPMQISDVDGWFERGMEMPSIDATGLIEQFKAEYSKRVIETSNPENEKLIKEQAAMIAELRDRLDDLEEAPSTKGGK